MVFITIVPGANLNQLISWGLTLYIYIYIVYDMDISLGCLEHFLLFHILGRIGPTDFHIFQRGRSTTNQIIYIYIQCEAPKIAKLVQKTPMSLWFMVFITIVPGANLNQLISWGPHIVDMCKTI